MKETRVVIGNKNGPSLITPNEVADSARVTTRTVRRWTAEGKLTPVKLTSRIIRYKADQVEALLNGE